MSNLYCDFLYTPTGHHDQDFMVLNNYCDGKLTHIKRNEKNGIVEVSFDVYNQNNELVLKDVTEAIVKCKRIK